MKRFWSLVLVGVLGLLLTGCSGGNATDPSPDTPTANEVAAPAEDAVKIEEIEWEVGQKTIDGDRCIAFSYTNNSEYPLLGIDMEFTQKSDVTDEQRTAFDELYEDDGMWEDFNGGRDEVYISADNTKLIEPGESVDLICYFNHTARRPSTMEQYELMEPSIMSIAYVADGRLYIEYYDFLNDSYSLDSQSGIAADSWQEDGLVAGLPKPDSEVITAGYSSDDHYSVSVFGYTRDEFDAYVDACKEAGFSEEPDEESSSYDALDADGRELSLFYNAEDEIMSFSLDVPADEE